MRCRNVNMAMSSGPLNRPHNAIDSAMGSSPAGQSRIAVVPMKSVAGSRIIRRSRPSVRILPETKAESTPAAPLRPNIKPTTSCPRPSRFRTINGTTISTMPLARFITESEMASERRVRLFQV